MKKTYHYIITISVPGQNRTRTKDDRISVTRGERRIEIFHKICDGLDEVPGTYVVLFFSLEPDEM